MFAPAHAAEAINFTNQAAGVSNDGHNAAIMVFFVSSGIMLFMVGVMFLFLLKYQVKTLADYALVRTGHNGLRICINGSMFYIPFLHSMAWVPLKVFSINKTIGGDSPAQYLKSKDGRMFRIVLSFAVQIINEAENIEMAARGYGFGNNNRKSDEGMKIINALGTIIDSSIYDVFDDFYANDILNDRALLRDAISLKVDNLAQSNLGTRVVSVNIDSIEECRFNMGKFGLST